MKLDPKDFDTLHQGLDALQIKARNVKNQTKRHTDIARIKSAREALDTIGTY